MIVVCHVVFELRQSDVKVIVSQLCNFKVSDVQVSGFVVSDVGVSGFGVDDFRVSDVWS